MAIKPGYKTFTFDGERSGDYNTYITGSAVYNAPEREVEMIEIPGRNGAFALDKGRFQNIEVTYPAGICAESQEEFAEALSDLRNMLCSRRGYCRLEDEYNPDEYRMAVYKSGLDVDPAAFQRAGEFEITFECKPQRWLKSGEAKQTIATSGDEVTNPTLFESSPLLEIEGYGTVSFNGYEIKLDDEIVGDVIVTEGLNEATNNFDVVFPEVFINTNDQIEINAAVFRSPYRMKSLSAYITSATITSQSGDGTATINSSQLGYTIEASFTDPIVFTYGTAEDKEITVDVTIKYVVVNQYTSYRTYTYKISYDGNKTINCSMNISPIPHSEPSNLNISSGIIIIHSTATTYGHPTYIDCDLGEAYTDEGGSISSLNAYIDLGSNLPTLAVGNNTITFDNTITDLKVTPRWWKI